MLDILRKHLKPMTPALQLNGLREYLQKLILQAMDDAGYRKNLAFTGGTALRIIYGTERFSEDIDFSLVNPQGFQTRALAEDILLRLRRLGLHVEQASLKDQKIVGSFFLRFAELLHPLGLGAAKDHKLSIKVEVDQNPPKGGHIQEFLGQDPVLFLVNHYDLPSLFATKIHAVLFRKYEKGRDYFDLLYYLGKKVIPDLKLFQNAARQTYPDRNYPTLQHVLNALQEKVSEMNEKNILRDVEPFLLTPSQARFLTRPVILKSLEQSGALW